MSDITCPRCGCRPHYVRAAAVVLFALDDKGKYIQKSVSAVSITTGTRTYVCGGGHTWEVEGAHVDL